MTDQVQLHREASRYQADAAELSHGLSGRAFARGAVGYESARFGAVVNGRKPERYPDVVVQAASATDVVAAVTFARDRGMKIGVRSGGHSWSASFCREGGMLLDVSRLDHCEISPDNRRAVVGPGLWGSRLNLELAAYDLFFPGGHCGTVALGGYLLQGGFGLGSRGLRPACASVRGIDVVTAAGAQLHLSKTENADLFWAARGSGAGFFAAVTSFELEIYPRPEAFVWSRHEFSVSDLDELLRWSGKLSSSIPPRAELNLAITGAIHERGEPTVMTFALSLAPSEEDGVADLGFMKSCPVRSRALSVTEDVLTTLEWERAEEARIYPAGMRFAMDNTCTDAEPDELTPIMHELVDSLPPAPAHLLWMPWGRTPQPEDMAYSMESDLFINACAMWTDPADDVRFQRWVTDSMRKLEPLSLGTRLSDENQFDRPFRFMDDVKLRRVEALREQYDPSGVFHCVWHRDGLVAQA
jgi:FAD/FMN-containing dehydrogenase